MLHWFLRWNPIELTSLQWSLEVRVSWRVLEVESSLPTQSLSRIYLDELRSFYWTTWLTLSDRCVQMITAEIYSRLYSLFYNCHQAKEEISQPQLDGWLWHFVQTFTGARERRNDSSGPLIFTLAPLWVWHFCFVETCLSNHWMICHEIYGYSSPPSRCMLITSLILYLFFV